MDNFHQKAIRNSIKLLHPSKELLIQNSKRAMLIGKLLIVISIPVMLLNYKIGIGIALAGMIQTISSYLINKKLFLK